MHNRPKTVQERLFYSKLKGIPNYGYIWICYIYLFQRGYSPLFRRSVFPKIHCSESSLFRRFIVPKKRFIVPKVYWSEGSFIRNRGSLLRRFIIPKVHCSEIEVHCSEGSFNRNRGSLLRRFIIPKVQYSEISHLSDRKMLICYDKNEMIRAFGRAIFVHLQAELGQEMVHEMTVTEVPPNI